MNKEKIIANAGTIFSDLKEVSDNIYKGELRIDNKSAGVYFLDLHGNVKAADFKNLQEEVLAEEYYNQKNELQWNIYFLLITDSVVSKDKELIEKDEKYARKYVFTEAEFLDFFTLDKDSGEIQTDIVGDWKKKLDAVDLQEVYGKETYVESVSRFITDKTLKIKTVSTTTQLPDSLKINFVNKITIKPSFRTYPIIRQFEFGKVNLLKGVNGVGKTSTLEAIEMIVCGRTFRNPDKMEEEGCVQAIINNRTVESFAPSNKGKYRQRDFEWYNNSYTRDNNIQRSFNRFNFFDSDASNNFSQSNSETEINQALENLILGGDFKYLKDRVNGFYNRLSPELKKISSAIDEAKAKIKAADQILSKDRIDTNIDLLLKELNSKISDLKINNPINIQPNNLGLVDILLNQLKAIINRVQKSTNDFKNSPGTIKHRIKLLDERVLLFNEFRIEFSSLEKTISETALLRNVITSQIEILQESVELLENPKLLLLEGIGKKILLAKNNVNKIQQIENTLVVVNFQLFTDSSTADNYLAESQKDVVEIKQQLSKISLQINEKLQLLGSLERLIREVKDKGKEILLFDKEIENCPLCNTHLGNEELSKQINNLVDSVNIQDSSTNSGDLTKQRLDKEKDLQNAELRVKVVQKIKSIYDEVFDKPCNNIALSDAIKELNSFYLQKSEFEAQLNELESIEQFGFIKNISEERIRIIKITLNSLLEGKFKLKREEKNSIEEELNSLRGLKVQREEEINKLTEKKAQISQDIKTKLDLLTDQTFMINEVTGKLNNELEELGSLHESYNELMTIISFDESERIDDLYLKAELVEKNLTSLRAAIAADQQISQAKKNRDEGDKYLKQNDNHLKRLQKAIEVLSLMNSNGGSSELTAFFNTNFKQILEIFKTIHTPREFKDLQYRNGQILLIDNLDTPRKVSEISTGQRAALALSIFISMNRMLKNGPNIIIFDDPISHVDDLNALSFLDFLRIFILREKKQIFFASANSRLATLFQKKFQFLGNDFKLWELEREIVPAVLDI